MKVTHISTYDKGGAANAAIRLHEGLLENNIDSFFLTNNKSRIGIKNHYLMPANKYNIVPDQQLTFKNLIRSKFSKSYKKYLKNNYQRKVLRKAAISAGIEIITFPETNYRVEEHDLLFNADIIHLHWVGGFLNYPTFFENINKPVIWTIHDENPFRGIYHYKNDENKNLLPLLKADDYAKTLKSQCIQKFKNIHFVFPSLWLKEEAKANGLSVETSKIIPYGINTNVFKRYAKDCIKSMLNIDNNNPIFLFVADKLSNFRKGFDILLDAFTQIKINYNVNLIAIGEKSETNHFKDIKFTGLVHDELLMAMYYNVADAFIIPSREDNLPNTMLESLCCGTPVIGLKIGGITETINEGENGYLADQISGASLYKQLERFLINLKSFNNDKIAVRSSQKYSINQQTSSYLDIYNSLL